MTINRYADHWLYNPLKCFDIPILSCYSATGEHPFPDSFPSPCLQRLIDYRQRQLQQVAALVATTPVSLEVQ